jgi:hypothetical protein
MKTSISLTVKSDIIGISGQILLSAGSVVTIKKIIKRGGYYGKVSGYWIDPEIIGVTLFEINGIWFPSCFNESLY